MSNSVFVHNLRVAFMTVATVERGLPEAGTTENTLLLNAYIYWLTHNNGFWIKYI